MTDLTAVLPQLELERTRLASQLAKLNIAISALNGTGAHETRRALSAPARARIAAAQRARWAKVKRGKVRILVASESRIVFDVENVDTIRYHLFPIIQPGELQSIYFLDHESGNAFEDEEPSPAGQPQPTEAE